MLKKCFSKCAKSPNVSATFVDRNLQKSPNLVTLQHVKHIPTHLSRSTYNRTFSAFLFLLFLTHTQLSPFLQIEKTHFKFYLTLSLSSILSKMPFHIILVVCPLSFCPILSYRGSCKILKLFIMLSKSH